MSRDYKGDKAPHERNGVVQTDTVERAIFHSGEVVTFSTPTTMDAKATNTPEIAQKFLNDGRQTCLTYEVLLGTPRTSSANGSSAKEVKADAPKARIEDQVLVQSWGKFEPAIRRWEETLGRPAPAPTQPDGKDGSHRLSSAFTEWMMGLPEGWITDVGLSRNEELKACGNGVVPQQAELALRILLEGIDFESKRGAGMAVLPTPTLMDQRDGKHFRSVAIRELAIGNNRGLNLNNIVETGLTDWEDGDKFEIVDGKAVKTNG